MQDNIYNLIIFVGGLLSVFIGHMFDVPPAILWTAAIGSAAGVAIRKPSNKIHALGWIFVGTMAMGFAIPLIAHFWWVPIAIIARPLGIEFSIIRELSVLPLPVQKAMAVFIPMVFIGYRHKFKDWIDRLIDKAFGRAEKIIGGE